MAHLSHLFPIANNFGLSIVTEKKGKGREREIEREKKRKGREGGRKGERERNSTMALTI